jgi:hypothetical protein
VRDHRPRDRPVHGARERDPTDRLTRAPLRPTRTAIVAVVLLFAVTLVAAQSCQQAQIRISEEQAVATARERVAFAPEQTQVRLVRQGLNGRPYWAVSLSVPAPGGGYARLTTVRVDANTGAVAAVNREAP